MSEEPKFNHQEAESQNLSSSNHTSTDDIFSRPFVPDTPEETPTPESDFVEPTTPYGTPPELLESIDNSSELREKKKNNAEPIALVASILAVFSLVFRSMLLSPWVPVMPKNPNSSRIFKTT